MRSAVLAFLGAVALAFADGSSIQRIDHAPFPGRERQDGAAGTSPSSEREPVFPSPAVPPGARPAPDVPSGAGAPSRRPFTLVQPERMLADLEELTAIGRGEHFRTSASRGERQAFDWLERRISGLKGLAARGATLERLAFRVPVASEVRSATLSVGVAAGDVSVPAYAIQGNRDDPVRALRFDTDGRMNDDVPDPAVADGSAFVARSVADVVSLAPGALRGRVLLADFAVMDRGVVGAAAAQQAAAALLRPEPAALVLVTRYSNVRGEAHGSFVGDTSALTALYEPAHVPTVYVKLEDLGPAGIRSIADLRNVSRARVTLDVDVFSPADSQLLAFTVPGRDPSRAILLGAHLDSPNSPGALDDGSGSVALLEAARALDESRVPLPVDTVFLWFGSHERGLFGSSTFVNARSELLDRTVAMLQLDCLTHPLDGMGGSLVFESQSHRAFGEDRLPAPATLAALAGRAGVGVLVYPIDGMVSDNSSFDGYDVPSVETIFLAEAMAEVHVDGHLHDPYDDVPLARLHGTELTGFARIVLSAVLDLPDSAPSLRVTPAKTGRAVFVSSHNEAVHMTPAHLSQLGLALAWEGWDVDVVPYGSPVTAADLEGAGLVVVLPVLDYPSPASGAATYDEAWTDGEVAALRGYAGRGGLLVVTNSSTRLRYGTTPADENEDALDANAVAEALGVAYEDRRLSGTEALVTSVHPLTSGLESLALTEGNGLAVRPGAGAVLARAGSDVAVALAPFGASGGEVLVLADLAILGGRTATSPNLPFFRNLARYARTRTGR